MIKQRSDATPPHLSILLQVSTCIGAALFRNWRAQLAHVAWVPAALVHHRKIFASHSQSLDLPRFRTAAVYPLPGNPLRINAVARVQSWHCGRPFLNGWRKSSGFIAHSTIWALSTSRAVGIASSCRSAHRTLEASTTKDAPSRYALLQDA